MLKLALSTISASSETTCCYTKVETSVAMFVVQTPQVSANHGSELKMYFGAAVEVLGSVSLVKCTCLCCVQGTVCI